MTSFDELLASTRANWRIVLLVVMLLGSSAVLFVPAGSDGPTNLKYGLELNGGTRVTAPLVGMTAEGVDYQGMNNSEIRDLEATVADELGVTVEDVKARPQAQAFEVYSDEFSASQITAALDEAGKNPDRVRDGVTDQTLETARDVIKQKLAESPEFTGGRVQITTSATGKSFIQIEVPNANETQVKSLVRERGVVRVVALFPENQAGGDGSTTTPTPTPATATATASGDATPTTTTQTETATQTETVTPTATSTPGADSDEESRLGFEVPEGYRAVSLFTQENLQEVGQAQESSSGQPYVPVTLTNSAGQEFQTKMQQYGFTGEGVEACNYNFNKEDPGYCLATVRNGEVVYAASMGSDLAQTIAANDFTQTNSFIMNTNNLSEARSLQIDLRAGSLPTEIALDEGTTRFILPSLAGKFKLFSLVTGLVAAMAVSVVVFFRYRDERVAIPMLGTAMAEVLILLGFAASIGLPLDLSHIAGFIAVIGTGVDDLIIIADEVMAQGDVRTRRVFQSRFRKAFWVIGAAAATTIIAMSPLAIIGLGDLSGFAVVTIVGVLVGVLVTRPAYGDVLRNLITESDE